MMTPSQWELSGKVALVTGGGSPLGRAAAVALAQAGADVAVVASDVASAEATAAEIRQSGRRAVALAGDVTSPAGASRAVRDTVAGLGRLDILVNAEETPFAKPLAEISADEWRRVIDGNLSSAFFCSQAAIAHMLSQGQGKVINLVSGLAERGIAQASVFSAAKAGVTALTRSLAIEHVRQKINVNAVGIGWYEGEGFNLAPLQRFIPVRRPGQPGDIAGAVVYLAAPVSDIITGEIIYVDGGILGHG